MAVPLFLGSPVALSSNSPGLDDHGVIAGLAGGNLAIARYQSDINSTTKSLTVEVRSAHGFGLLSSVVVDTSTASLGGLPQVVALTNGSFVVSWPGEYSTTIGHSSWFQVFDAAGLALGPPQPVSIDGKTNSGTDLAALADGGGAIAFDHFNASSDGVVQTGNWDAHVRLVGADGSLGAVVPLSRIIDYDHNEDTTRIVGLADGGFKAIWLRHDISTSHAPVSQIVTRDFAADGSPTSNETVLWTTDWQLLDPELTRLEGGQIAYSWRQVDLATNHVETAIGLLSSTGGVIMPPTLVSNEIHAGAPETVALQDGRLFFFWGEFDAQSFTVTLRGGFLSPAGVLSDPFTLVSGIPSSSTSHSVTELADGRLMLTFSQSDSYGRPDQMRQLLDPREAAVDLLGSAAADAWVGTGFDDTLNGAGGNDQINGWAGNDTLYGGADSDVLIGGQGADLLDGGAGSRDRAQYTDATAGLRADLQVAQFNTGFAAGDTFAGIEDLYGSSFGDTLLGNTGANVIWGDAGDDKWLDGRIGNDTLYGGAGNDVLVGGWGADVLDGGVGSHDRAQYTDATAGLRADLQVAQFNTGFAAGDTYAGIEDLFGSSFGDTLLGDTGGNLIWGAAGNDLIDGRLGNDTMIGGAGQDTLTGGSGADVFVFETALGAGNIDRINGYSLPDDTIQLENAIFTALTATGTLAASAFVTGAAATTAAHRIIYNSVDGQLLYDADGNGAGAAVLFATLSAGLVFGAAEFVIA